jgi:hypothetical protein
MLLHSIKNKPVIIGNTWIIISKTEVHCKAIDNAKFWTLFVINFVW